MKISSKIRFTVVNQVENEIRIKIWKPIGKRADDVVINYVNKYVKYTVFDKVINAKNQYIKYDEYFK
jgi:hypothetical protein